MGICGVGQIWTLIPIPLNHSQVLRKRKKTDIEAINLHKIMILRLLSHDIWCQSRDESKPRGLWRSIFLVFLFLSYSHWHPPTIGFYILRQRNMVYVTSTNIPSLTSGELLQLLHKVFALLDLDKQGNNSYNHDNSFKIKCMEVNHFIRELTTEEDYWMDHKFKSLSVAMNIMALPHLKPW